MPIVAHFTFNSKQASLLRPPWQRYHLHFQRPMKAHYLQTDHGSTFSFQPMQISQLSRKFETANISARNLSYPIYNFWSSMRITISFSTNRSSRVREISAALRVDTAAPRVLPRVSPRLRLPAACTAPSLLLPPPRVT